MCTWKVGGLVSLLIGGYFFTLLEDPSFSLLLLGTFVGISLLIEGIFLGLQMRKAVE